MIKKLYDLVVVYGLATIAVLALSALGLQVLAGFAASFTGDGEALFLWQRVASGLGVQTVSVRLVVFGVAQLAVFILLNKPLRALWALVDRVLDGVEGAGRWGSALGRVLSVLFTILLIPMVLQPTLVPLRMDRSAWVERSANLLDGTASGAAVASAVRAWRWAFPPPLHNQYAGSGSRMDRWDPLLQESTRDANHFAQTKAFMYVESAGRQYAVSRTGCAGLMQFCVTTAQRRPFGQIFGTGAVSACNCGGKPCVIPREVSESLEVDPHAVDIHRDSFPCDVTDARFDPERAIRAGAAYTQELSDQVGGNLPLMYIGYNSGPAVAKRLWTATGKNPRVSIDQLRPHLAPTLRRWYGDRATSRANGLLDVHLPKLLEAHARYLE